MTDEVARPHPTKFEERITQAAKVMGISIDDLWRYLGALGIDNDQDGQALLEAETTQEGDARAVMVEGKSGWPIGEKAPQLVKIARFKAGWAVLKGKGTDKTEKTELIQIMDALRPAAQLSDRDLLEKYGQDCPWDILEQLKLRSQGRACIIFKEDGETIDVDTSLTLLREAKRKDTPLTYCVTTSIGISARRTYRIGEFPMMFVEECPIHQNTLLTNGYCDDCKLSWLKITQEDRIIVRVAHDAGAIDTNPAKIYELFKKIEEKNASFLLEIPVIELRYRELKEENKLPILRRKISRQSGGDPFFVNHRTF